MGGGVSIGTAWRVSSHAPFDANATVQLQVATGAIASWSGDCTGAASCSVIMNQNRRVVATFALSPAPPVIVVNSTKPVVVMNRSVQEVRMSYAIVNGGGVRRSLAIEARASERALTVRRQMTAARRTERVAPC